MRYCVSFEVHSGDRPGKWPFTLLELRSMILPLCSPMRAYINFWPGPSGSSEGMKLLGTALLLNGISMSICGSSRRASGSEHLISHALDSVSKRPRLHGLQVGVATYLISLLQGQNSRRIAALFDATGFWAPSQTIHLSVLNGLKRPASRRRSNRTFIPSYPLATASWKSRALFIPTLTCDSASGLDPRRLAYRSHRPLDLRAHSHGTT